MRARPQKLVAFIQVLLGSFGSQLPDFLKIPSLATHLLEALFQRLESTCTYEALTIYSHLLHDSLN